MHGSYYCTNLEVGLLDIHHEKSRVRLWQIVWVIEDETGKEPEEPLLQQANVIPGGNRRDRCARYLVGGLPTWLAAPVSPDVGLRRE